MIAHRLSTIRNADQICVLEAAVSSNAARTNCLAGGLYRDLYERQFVDVQMA